ncbi:MAG: class I SAM-dependent methyltransferase [Pseudomonadota bacterium]
MVIKGESAARDADRRIAAAYDFWSWKQDYSVPLDPAALVSAASPYGGSDCVTDILDLGCGAGGLLAAIGDQSSGRLIGTDISPKSCELAREAVAVHGQRAEILNADLLDLSGDQLGQFDLIYCLGVLYAVPPAVRDHSLRLIGSCLKPGGIAVVSYYSGTTPSVLAQIARGARAVTRDIVDPAQRVVAAREYIAGLRTVAERPSHYSRGLKTAFNYIDCSPDPTLFGDSLNEACESLSTVELAELLAPHGIEFAAYLGIGGFQPWYSSRDRAVLAERLDLMGGQFHYALFVKPNRARPAAPHGEAEHPGRDELPLPQSQQVSSLPRSARKLARWLFWRLFGA